MFLRTSLPIKGIAILALLFTFQSATAQWPSDRITFDTNRDQNGPRSLVIDGDNTLHAVWSKHLSGSNAVFYAQQRCEEPWSVPEVISFASFSSGPPTIALDPTNNDKVIAYGWAMGATSNINVVRGNMGSWTTMQVTNGTNIERTPTVSVDDQGKIHLAWTSEDSSGTWKVHYAHDRAGTWTEQRILLSNPGPFGGGAGPKIALDLNGAPSIAYREGDFGSYTIERLWMIHPDSTSWSGEFLDTPAGEELVVEQVIDVNGTIHAAISGNNGFGFSPDAYYIVKPLGGFWSMPVQIDNAEDAHVASLFVDGSGGPHIGLDGISGNIYTGNTWYAHIGAVIWYNDTINYFTNTNYSVNANMVVDLQGHVHALVSMDDAVSIDSGEVYHFYLGSCFPTAIKEPVDAPVSLYPNPAHEGATVVLPEGLDVLEWSIWTLDGKMIRREEANDQSLQVDVSQLASGSYFILLKGPDTYWRKRLTVSH